VTGSVTQEVVRVREVLVFRLSVHHRIDQSNIHIKANLKVTVQHNKNVGV